MNRTIDSLKSFIYKEAHKFAKSSNVIDEQDLYQVGCIALINAKRTFDKDKGKWITYAMCSIRNAIMNEAARFLKGFTVNPNTAKRFYKTDKLIKAGHPDEFILNELGITAKELGIFRQVSSCVFYSDSFSDDEIALGQFSKSFTHYDIEFLSDVLERYDRLSKDEKQLILLRQSLTLHKIGKKYNVSRECIRHRYDRILEKLLGREKNGKKKSKSKSKTKK